MLLRISPSIQLSSFNRCSSSSITSLSGSRSLLLARSARPPACLALAMAAASHPTAAVVSIPYSDLQDIHRDLSGELEVGFGPGGLGIVAVSGVPQYGALRRRLLHLAERLATLPEGVRKSLEDPDSRYSFGWSHGKEILDSGQADVLKGSFYANPIIDKPTSDKELMERYPSYCRPNLWPTMDLPELEPAFKELGKLIIDVGLLLSYHCDKYVALKNQDVAKQRLEELLRHSRCHKGRLLHYFAPTASAKGDDISNSISTWCGWHTDHGSLTGLTCAMYMNDSHEVPCPDKNAGLYVKTFLGDIVKATFEEDHIGYQMGEATEFLSGGLFHATPHCVQTARGEAATDVVRNTFAVFMQPHWDQPLTLDPKHKESLLKADYLSFGDFTEATLSKYYKNETPVDNE